MNFSKGYNVFSDIPGFDASKGERIVKALQKLWEKINSLEQIRNSERKSRSEESQTDSKDEDLTITDVQYKLLVLQLQYARSILKKKLHKNDDLDSKITQQDKKQHVYSTNYPDDKTKNIADSHGKVDRTEESNPSINKDVSKNAIEIIAQISTNNQSFKPGENFEQLATVANKTKMSKPHYHMKLDDVPFILGASSTASHSVVANVQNIIAMMKSHNKALCGPKHHASRSSTSNPNFPKEDSQDVTKMLNQLSQDLYKLALKQQKLVKKFDATQEKNHTSNMMKKFQKDDEKHFMDHDDKRSFSNSESDVKLHAEVKNISKRKAKDFVTSYVQPNQNTLNVRNQPSNLSIMDRRKLLRSLQNFKSHLSEEDISWD